MRCDWGLCGRFGRGRKRGPGTVVSGQSQSKSQTMHRKFRFGGICRNGQGRNPDALFWKATESLPHLRQGRRIETAIRRTIPQTAERPGAAIIRGAIWDSGTGICPDPSGEAVGGEMPEGLATVADLRNLNNFRPFEKLRVLTGGEAEPNPDEHTFMDYCTGMYLRERAQREGMHPTLKFISQHSKRNTKWVLDKFARFSSRGTRRAIHKYGLFRRSFSQFSNAAIGGLNRNGVAMIDKRCILHP